MPQPNGLNTLKPVMDLNTAAPDRYPVGITYQGERKVYMMRAVEELSTRERKRILTLMRAIAEFDEADEENIEDSDYAAYDAALSEITSIVMADVPLNVLHSMPYTEHVQIVRFLGELFTRVGQTRTAPADEAKKPGLLRALAAQLTSEKSSPASAVSTADDQASG